MFYRYSEFETSLNEIGVENDITTYPDMNHAFVNPSGDRYAPDEARMHGIRHLNFLK